LRTGLAGCGRIARLFHLPALVADPAFDLVAVADPDPDALAAAAAAAPGAVALDDVDALVARADLDAVVVCAPTGLHEALAVAALDAGRHLYLEKPLAITAPGARAGTVAMIGLNLRLHPVFVDAQAQLAAGAVGEVVGVQTRFCAAGRDLPSWKQRRASGGGALLDLASHHVDLVPHLLGDGVVEVDATVRSVATEADTAALSLRLAGGVTVQSLFSMTAAQEDVVVVQGTRGVLVADRYRSEVRVEPSVPAGGRRAQVAAATRASSALARGAWRTLRPRPDPSFAAGLAAFAAAVQGTGPAEPSLAAGRRSLAVVLAAEEADATGRPVTVGPSSGSAVPRADAEGERP
jgi:predicted dehydrogenase